MTRAILYDAIIVGGGPGGLSAALGLGRQNRTCIVISHKQFRNDGIEASHAVLGHDHIHPQTIWARGREQIARYGNTTYAEAEVVSAKRERLPQWCDHEGFTVKSKDDRSWTGKTLVLATGVKDLFPNLEGYQANWPRNIYQCLFCDGWERRHVEKAILCLPAFSTMEAGMASMALGQYADRNTDGSAKVTILTNGPWDINQAESKLAKQVKALVARGVKLDQRKVIKLENGEPGREGVFVHLQDLSSGSEERCFYGFIVHKPKTTMNAADLIQQLGLSTQQGMFGEFLKIESPTQNTNVQGVFAAGDSANNMTHVTTAMSTGVSAAAGVCHYLNEIDSGDALMDAGNVFTKVDEKPIEAGCDA